MLPVSSQSRHRNRMSGVAERNPMIGVPPMRSLLSLSGRCQVAHC